MKKLITILIFCLLTLPNISFAAWKFIGGAELNSVTDGVEITSNTAPIATSSTAHSGSYSWEVKNGTGFQRQVIYTTNQAAIGWLRAWVYITAYPNVNTQFLRWSNASNVSQGNITMSSTGTLTLLKVSGASIGSASSAIPLNTWTCVALGTDASGSGTLTGEVGGVSFASGANSAAGTWARALWGNVTGSQTSNDILFDDIAVTDGTTGDPGCGSTVFFHPNAGGDANSWLKTAGGTGDSNNFNIVNETPPDDATSFVSSALLNSEDLYKFNSSGTHSYDTINAIGVGTRYANDTANAIDSYQIEWESASGGTKATSASILPNSTTWSSYGVQAAKADSFQFSTTTTSTGTALTNTVLDNMQAGYIENAFSLNKIEVTNIWMYADYTPGTAPAGSGEGYIIMFN